MYASNIACTRPNPSDGRTIYPPITLEKDQPKAYRQYNQRENVEVDWAHTKEIPTPHRQASFRLEAGQPRPGGHWKHDYEQLEKTWGEATHVHRT